MEGVLGLERWLWKEADLAQPDSSPALTSWVATGQL